MTETCKHKTKIYRLISVKTNECMHTYDDKHDVKTQMDQTNTKDFDTQSKTQECPNEMTEYNNIDSFTHF